MNKVMLIGNLTADPEVNTYSGDNTVCRFSIAINRFARGGEAQADFIRIVTFGASAENCGKYLTKGSKVAVEGRLQTSSFEKDGQKRTSMDVVAERVEFLNRAGEGNGQAPAAAPKAKATVNELKPIQDEDDLPF